MSCVLGQRLETATASSCAMHPLARASSLVDVAICLQYCYAVLPTRNSDEGQWDCGLSQFLCSGRVRSAALQLLIAGGD